METTVDCEPVVIITVKVIFNLQVKVMLMQKAKLGMVVLDSNAGTGKIVVEINVLYDREVYANF